MLLTQYLAEHDVYMVIPVVNRRPDDNTEYVFADEKTQLEFIQAYNLNPYAAHFAYHCKEVYAAIGELEHA